jgi:CRP/FNR family cyclic AMP-dependent transcriptional regulator
MAMTKAQKTKLLRGVSLFAGLGARALSAIAERVEVIDFPGGRFIVRQGQIGTGFYLIVSGRAKVLRGNETLNTLGPGDFFGELSVLDQAPRMAHVRTEEPTTCLALASWEFTTVLEENPKVTLQILREVVRRLREATEQHRH